MDTQLNISVNVAGRPYRMKVTPDEEINVRAAANALNAKIAEFQQSYSATDQQDYLAMAALLFTTEKMKLETNTSQVSDVVEQALAEIDQEIHSIEQTLSPTP